MEKDFYRVDNFLKITKEVKKIDTPDTVTINGEEVKVSSGFQEILRLYFHEVPLKRISFFFPPVISEKDYNELEATYIETLCKGLADPIYKFLKSFKINVAIHP